jgi:hypothetical protein
MPILKSWGPGLEHCDSFLHRFPSFEPGHLRRDACWTGAGCGEGLPVSCTRPRRQAWSSIGFGSRVRRTGLRPRSLIDRVLRLMPPIMFQ